MSVYPSPSWSGHVNSDLYFPFHSVTGNCSITLSVPPSLRLMHRLFVFFILVESFVGGSEEAPKPLLANELLQKLITVPDELRNTEPMRSKTNVIYFSASTQMMFHFVKKQFMEGECLRGDQVRKRVLRSRRSVRHINSRCPADSKSHHKCFRRVTSINYLKTEFQKKLLKNLKYFKHFLY